MRTIGYHVVKTGYGLWLPGDERGSWSPAWDDQIGYIEPHTLHPGDAVRKRMAEERIKHPPVRLTEAMMAVVSDVIGECATASSWSVVAASIETTHIHLLLTYSPRDLANTIKWLGQQMTKAIHERTDHQGPVWAKGA